MYLYECLMLRSGMDNWHPHRIPDATPGRTAQLTGVARKPKHPSQSRPISVHVWWPGTDGAIEHASRSETEAEWRRSRVGGDGTTTPAGALASVTINEEHLQVFWITPLGGVGSAYWLEGSDGFTRNPVAADGSASARGGIAAISRQEGLMEVWWVGPGGSIEGAWWSVDAPKTWNHYSVAPPGSAGPSSRIAAVSRFPEHTEIFWIGADSSVQGAFWYGSDPTWRRYEVARPGQAAGHSGIAAACRDAEHMHLAWIGELGSVESAFWDHGGPWTLLAVEPPGAAAPEAAVTMAARDGDHVDIWWTGADGVVGQSSYVGGRWVGQRFPTTTGQSDVGGLASVSPFAESYHVWWVDSVGEVHGSRWFDEPIEVAVRYRGLRCFGETDWDGGSEHDEPYIVLSVLAPDGSTTTLRSQIYTKVDGGDTRADLIELYRGPAYGIQLGLLLMEYDSGSPNTYREQVDAVVKGASSLITAGVTAGGGPVAGLAVGSVLGAAGPAIADAINDALDSGDDQLGTQTLFLDRRRLHELVGVPYQHDDDMEYQLESGLFTGEGASYKARFDVIAV